MLVKDREFQFEFVSKAAFAAVNLTDHYREIEEVGRGSYGSTHQLCLQGNRHHRPRTQNRSVETILAAKGRRSLLSRSVLRL